MRIDVYDIQADSWDSMKGQDASDGKERKNNEVKMSNKDKGLSILDNRGNDLEVGNNLMYSAKVRLEHLTARMNTAKNRFGKDGKGQTMKSLKCNDRQFELYLVGGREPLEIRAAELNFRKITLATMRKMNCEGWQRECRKSTQETIAVAIDNEG